MREFALALSTMTAPHHHWPMKPAPEPTSITASCVVDASARLVAVKCTLWMPI